MFAIVGQQQVRRDQYQARDPLGMLGGQDQIVSGAPPRHDDRAPGAGLSSTASASPAAARRW
jgi:hypothetical protein